MIVDERTVDMLEDLACGPHMTVDEMGKRHGWGRDGLRKRLADAAANGYVGSVPHALVGRNASQRFCLTREGVKILAENLGVRVETVMDRPGTTNRALVLWRRRLDILACVYRTVVAMAEIYEAGDVCTHLYSAGPLDAAVRVPGPPGRSDDPFWLGVMVARPAFRLKDFGLRLWEYGRAREHRPAALLVISPNRMEDRGVARSWRCRRRFHQPDLAPASA